MTKKSNIDIFYTSFYVDRIFYMINHIENSEAGKREFHDGKYVVRKSTYPWYIKFAFVKKPKSYFNLSEEEKLSHEFYYQFNSKEVIRILNKSLHPEKYKMTKIQGNFLEELFYNFNTYENDFEEENGEKLFKEKYLESCPF